MPTARRPLTEEGELRSVFEAAGFTGVADTKVTVGMDYTNFDDFWYPTVYGQSAFATFFDALPEARRVLLHDAVRAAYLAAGSPDGARGFPSFAWAVREMLEECTHTAGGQVSARTGFVLLVTAWGTTTTSPSFMCLKADAESIARLTEIVGPFSIEAVGATSPLRLYWHGESTRLTIKFSREIGPSEM